MSGRSRTVRVVVDGVAVEAVAGQSVAGLLIGMGRASWRSTRRDGRPRGVFCGIGVCFDCLVVVNGVPDVRACQRVLADGDVVRVQDGAEIGEV
ncbi:(2Fe-2S)-binding protein [Crossiella sp. NPDC003009]